MNLWLLITSLIVVVVLSGVFATLTFSLRDFSKARLGESLERRKLAKLLDLVNDNASELAFLTATMRLLCNLAVLLLVFHLVRDRGFERWAEYAVAASTTALLTLAASVMLPHALAQYAGEPVIALFVRPLLGLRVVFKPLLKILMVTEHIVRRATTVAKPAPGRANADMQLEILAVVEEGEKTGVVDEVERVMIESVMLFRSTYVGQVMTGRPDIIGLPIDASLDKILSVIEESGHSRIPVYEGTLDHVIGILYARDLLRYVGETPAEFDIRRVIRPPLFVPESKPLRDLLQDFRVQKVHIAIVLDEYGGTAGLVSIEDLLEELVGEISDEHEPVEPELFRRLDDQSAEVDGKIHLDELNRLMGTDFSDDA
ncbi:MAG TPA: hemolysin family protein, partial [Tepidisphaeraceae bacterium]